MTSLVCVCSFVHGIHWWYIHGTYHHHLFVKLCDIDIGASCLLNNEKQQAISKT